MAESRGNRHCGSGGISSVRSLYGRGSLHVSIPRRVLYGFASRAFVRRCRHCVYATIRRRQPLHCARQTGRASGLGYARGRSGGRPHQYSRGLVSALQTNTVLREGCYCAFSGTSPVSLSIVTGRTNRVAVDIQVRSLQRELFSFHSKDSPAPALPNTRAPTLPAPSSSR
jgi:hypothetical protein